MTIRCSPINPNVLWLVQTTYLRFVEVQLSNRFTELPAVRYPSLTPILINSHAGSTIQTLIVPNQVIDIRAVSYMQEQYVLISYLEYYQQNIHSMLCELSISQTYFILAGDSVSVISFPSDIVYAAAAMNTDTLYLLLNMRTFYSFL